MMQNPEKFIMNLQIFQDFASFLIPLTMPALKDGPIYGILFKIKTVSKSLYSPERAMKR
jgi:hypothetical protein